MNVNQSHVRMEALVLMGMVLIPVNVPVDLMEQIVKQVCEPTPVVFPSNVVSFKLPELKYLNINKFVEKYVLCYSDIDECTVSNPCHEKATCNDTFGSFNCLCDPGFTGDGLNCTDIDECEINLHDCHVNGTCENTEGSFKCHCGPWYQPIDGYNGVKTRNCTLGMNIYLNFI